MGEKKKLPAHEVIVGMIEMYVPKITRHSPEYNTRVGVLCDVLRVMVIPLSALSEILPRLEGVRDRNSRNCPDSVMSLIHMLKGSLTFAANAEVTLVPQ